MLTPTKETFNALIAFSLKIISDHTNIQTDRRGEFADNFLTKNTINAITISNIVFPNPIQLPIISISPLLLYDLSSAYVLVRSLFESYINFHYLLIDKSTPEEKELKYLLWDRHVFTERIKMSRYRNTVRYHIEADEKLVANLINQINSNAHFKSLSLNDQKRILKENKYSLLFVPEKSIRAGINENHTRFLYKFLSNYAHSDPFSIMQFNAVTNSGEAKGLIEGLPLIYAEAFLSLSISLYSNIFTDVKTYIESNTLLKTKIHFYSNWLKK